MDERRRWKRGTFASPLVIEGDETFHEHTEFQDISLGGMRIASGVPLVPSQVGKLYCCLFCGDEVESFYTKSRVVWINPIEGGRFDIGMEFIEMQPDSRQTLEQIVDLIGREQISSGYGFFRVPFETETVEPVFQYNLQD